MPKYLKDIKYMLVEPDVNAMLAACKTARDRFLIALLFRTGARPIEITKITREDILNHATKPEYFLIRLWTAKRKQPLQRTLEIKHSAPYACEIWNYASQVQEPSLRLVAISPTRIRTIVYKVSENRFCPYHFRHTRLTRLAQAGASYYFLKQWKGAADARSVDAYLAAAPVGSQLDVD